MNKFIDRIDERKILTQKTLVNSVEKILICGESGIGKSELVKEVYPINESLYFNKYGESYFLNILSQVINIGFNNYLKEINGCNYKDIFYNYYSNSTPLNDKLAVFILNSDIYIEHREVDLEEILAKFIIESSTLKNIIFEDIHVCTSSDRNRMIKLIKYLCVKSTRKIKIIYTLSELQGNMYNYFMSICDKKIELQGFSERYIEKLIQEYYGDDLMDCSSLANYLFDKYDGNPGKIINLMKHTACGNNNINQNIILEKLMQPQQFIGDPTEERILLILAVLPFAVTKAKMIRYLISDPDFPNIDNKEMCNIKINNLVARELILDHDGFLEMKISAKKIIRERAMTSVSHVYLIFNLQRKFAKDFSDTEKSDCLYFLISSNKIKIDEDTQKKFFCYTIKAAQVFAKNELWETSINYYERIMQYSYLFNESLLISMLKTLYYGARYDMAKNFIAQINDKDFTSYEYWYWKANIYYMINDSQSISFFDKAISFTRDSDEILQAEIMKNEAISELPEYCTHTLEQYIKLLHKYEDAEFKTMPLLYRNSLVMGGEKTIELCNKGITIAQKYNMQEEVLKLQHNKQFELFRMGEYADCFNVFEQVSLYFQKEKKRLYESAYGFNNLALVELINGNYETARLYATSAVIYANTPYSQIATNVNYNLIQSYCDYDENIAALEKRISKIESLLKKYKIQDNRMYRKSYFSIIISCVRKGQREKAKEYLKKVELYLQEGRHLNRYANLCMELNVSPQILPQETIQNDSGYYNFYANPHFELWLLAFGHI